MSDDLGSLPQTGASEPVSDNVGGREQTVISPDKAPKESLRDSIGKAYDEVAKPREDVPDEPVETAEQKAERLRDEQGRFARTEKPEVTEPKPGKVQIDPPVHWRGEQKLKWANVPNEIKVAIAEDAKQRSEIEAKAGQWESVITPERRQALQVAYGDERQGLNQILATVEFSNKDPMGFLRWFAQNRRIDLGSLVPNQEQPSGPPPELRQYLDPVLGKVTALEQMLQQSQSAAQQMETARVQQDLNTFLADHTNFPFAQDVRHDMAALFQSGQVAKSGLDGLKEAYDRAVWANPVTRQKLLAEQVNRQTQAQTQSAQAKRSLATSVTGAPGVGAPLPKAPIKENPRDTVRRVLQDNARI